MHKALLCFLFLSLSTCSFIPIIAQEAVTPIEQEVRFDQSPVKGSSLDKEAIDEYKNDPNYNYVEIEPEDTWITRLRRKLSQIWNSFLRWLTGGQEATGVLAFLLELLPYLLLAGLLALLIWVFLKIDNARAVISSSKKGVFIGDDEEIINNHDIQTLIDQALIDKNYRLAVRYYYLLTLQKLSGKELINWQAQKTNHEYIYEIKNSNLRQQFGKLTDVYDYIWYGNFEVDDSAFAKAQHAFNKINSEI